MPDEDEPVCRPEEVANFNSSEFIRHRAHKWHPDETLSRWLYRCSRGIEIAHERRSMPDPQEPHPDQESRLERARALFDEKWRINGNSFDSYGDCVDYRDEEKAALREIEDETLREALWQKWRRVNGQVFSIHLDHDMPQEEQKSRVLGLYEPLFTELLYPTSSATATILGMPTHEFIQKRPWTSLDNIDAVDWRLTRSGVDSTLKNYAVKDQIDSMVRRGFTKAQAESRCKSEMEAAQTAMSSHDEEIMAIINDMKSDDQVKTREASTKRAMEIQTRYESIGSSDEDVTEQKTKVKELWRGVIEAPIFLCLDYQEEKKCSAASEQAADSSEPSGKDPATLEPAPTAVSTH